MTFFHPSTLTSKLQAHACVSIWKKTMNQMSLSKGLTCTSRSREQDRKSSLQTVSKAGMQREAKLSDITLALEHLTGFLCLALQTLFLLAFLFLLSYAGSSLPNSVVDILLPETGILQSNIMILTNRCNSLRFYYGFGGLIWLFFQSTLCAEKWRHCKMPKPFSGCSC